ncbi:MAG: hypothetical protein NWF00_12350 [Candidatus Bathyarchaeota archaeon]|nr:hypothetical protein [Candidatus Bathyarchaeota archaeon]
MFDAEQLRALYEKVIVDPNKTAVRRGFVKCPECGKEILMIPTLKVMHSAIENHVKEHKEQLKGDLIKSYQAAIFVRLSLVSQVLSYACRPQVP